MTSATEPGPAGDRKPPAGDREPPAARPPLPPGLDLLWGRRERGKRGPRPGLSPEAIVEAAMAVADTEGLEAVSMARVAKELGFTTMSLYRYVDGKDELLQLMFNASAQGAESIVLTGEGWRARLRDWALFQREALDRHPWMTQMPMASPPLAPNSAHFVERAMEAMDETGLTDLDKLRMIGLLTSYTLADARMAYDAKRALATAAETTTAKATAAETTAGAAAGQVTWTYEALLRELIDEETYPRLYRLAWADDPRRQPDEREEFLFGLERILDGIQAYIDRTTEG